MSSLEAVAVALAAAFAAWQLAARTARARALPLGAFPLAAIPLIGGIAALAASRNALSLTATLTLGLASVAALTDARVGLIFDAVSYPSLALVAGTALLSGTLLSSAAGALAAGGFLALPYLATRGRGLGLGDLKLAVLVGSGLGWPDAAVALAEAFVLGGACGAALLIARRASRRTAVRFGPFIAAGVAGVLLLPGRPW